jgi:hypothetical protein
MYYDGRGTVLDHSGIVAYIDAGAVTVQFSKGNRTTYTLPATDFLSPLRECTGCHKPTILERCIGNGGCGAHTIPARKG